MSELDNIFNRKNTNSYKWDFLKERFGNDDILPLWVADMDFKSPEEVLKKMEEISINGFFGYTFKNDNFYNSIINWIYRKHNWKIEKENIFTTHGVVNGLSAAINALTNENDKIIIQTPVYYPFFHVIENNKREIVRNPLIIENGEYKIDFDNLNKIIDDKTKIFILCSPHNPVGRVWNKNELDQIADFVLKNNLILLSDEIHADLIFKTHKHIPIANISKDIANKTITFMAPSKTFNLPGLETSFAIIENEEYIEKFNNTINAWSIGGNNIYGIFATQTAYNHGGKWLKDVLDYIHENYIYLKEFFSKNMPQIETYPLEGTYLMWINCNKLNMSNEELDKFFIEEVKVGLNPGHIFGEEGNGFQRINIACPRKNLEIFANNFLKAIQH